MGVKLVIPAPSEISAKALGLPANVREVNAPLRQRLGMRFVADREVIDTRHQAVNLALTGKDRIKLMSTHEIPLNASAGVWYYPKSGTRFHAGYEDVKELCGGEKGSDQWVQWIFERTAAMQKQIGVKISLQCHYPGELGPQNVVKWVEMMQKTGIGVDSIVPLLFADAIFQHGSLTNTNKAIREFARRRQLETFQMADLLGIPTVNHWYGIDGVENTFGCNYKWVRDMIAGATADAMDAVPGQQATKEPKPYEPRGVNHMDSTAKGLTFARAIELRLTSSTNRALLDHGIRMVGMTPEIGHMQMGFENLPAAFMDCLMDSRLFCIHWNGQPKGNYDIDDNVGAYEFDMIEPIAWALQMAGYKGVNTPDINPLRMPLSEALDINYTQLTAAFSQARRHPHEKLMKAVNDQMGGGNAALQWYLLAIRRAGTPEGTKAMAKFEKIVAGLDATEN
ncbi:MAG: hypothetical protein NTZ10_05615 [Candidatus Saganbacteria bacterium]|nr:hypothetical protein [Candidatus Saganbacteria bacterium]